MVTLTKNVLKCEVNLLGMPETSLSGRSTLTALSVLRSKSAPTVARILHTQQQHWLKITGT